jgi:hypothetical protein
MIFAETDAHPRIKSEDRLFRDHALAAGHFAEEDAAFGLGGSRRLDQRYRDLIGSRAGILLNGLRDVFQSFTEREMACLNFGCVLSETSREGTTGSSQ